MNIVVPGVYFASTMHQYFKIGESSDIGQRIKALSKGCPSEVGLIAFYPIQDQAQRRRLEAIALRAVSEWQVKGEWHSVALVDHLSFFFCLEEVLVAEAGVGRINGPHFDTWIEPAWSASSLPQAPG